MATVSNIRRLTASGRAIATDKLDDPNTAIELIRIFDLIDVEVDLLATGTPYHRRRRTWRGLWRRNDR